MKNGFLVFLASLIALGGSWCGFVFAPVVQLGGGKQTTILNSTDLYPVDRPGMANQGLQVYRANGCAACHTEQVRQDGVVCDVYLTDYGTNTTALSKALVDVLSTWANDLPSKMVHRNNGTNLVIDTFNAKTSKVEPKAIMRNVSKNMADAAVGKITAAGGKAEIHIVATGPDIDRGWGRRHSVAEDFLYDDPVQLGSLRIGPDLADVGTRQPDANWQLVHLYAPQSVVKGSAMPPFRYLFRVKKIGSAPSPDALAFPKGFGPPAGYEVVPAPQAQELAAYLLSLHADVPLHDAPFTQAIAVSKP